MKIPNTSCGDCDNGPPCRCLDAPECRSGYASGFRGELFPPMEPLSSWFAFGWRHGYVDRVACYGVLFNNYRRYDFWRPLPHDPCAWDAECYG